MSFCKIEVGEKEYKLEYNRQAIVLMEEMGYNAFVESKTPLKDINIMVYGALYRHHKLDFDRTGAICDEMLEEYGLLELLKVLQTLVAEAYSVTPKGKKGKKKLVVTNVAEA